MLVLTPCRHLVFAIYSLTRVEEGPLGLCKGAHLVHSVVGFFAQVCAHLPRLAQDVVLCPGVANHRASAVNMLGIVTQVCQRFHAATH